MILILRELLFKVLLISTSLSLCGQEIYLSEASKNPFERTVFMDSTAETFHYTAHYLGTTRPDKDLSVKFMVDVNKVKLFNSKYGTVYEMLPKSSYLMSLTSAVIVKGSVSTQTGVVKVVEKEALKPFKKYLLPISARLVGGEVEEDRERSTIYYVIQATPLMTSIPQKKIGRFPENSASVFGYGDKYLITVSDDEKLTAYRYWEDNLGNSLPVEGSPYLKDLDNICNFRSHHIIGLNRNVNGGQLWGFPITADGGKILPMDKVFGTAGYGVFSEIIPFENYLYCLTPSGELKIYPLTDSLEWRFHAIRSMGSGWDYPVLFGYKHSFIAIDEKGDMWKFRLLTDGQLGLPKLIGRGWNSNDKIVVMGDDLLRIDKEGIVWRIAYSDFGNWVL